MEPIPVPLVDGDTLVIDNSSLETFSTCPRQSQYTIIDRLRSTAERPALRFGGIVHKALAHRYFSKVPMLEQTPELTMEMIGIMAQEYSTWTPPEDDHRTFDYASRLIEKYGVEYRYEPFDVVTLPNGKPAVEIPFAFPLGAVTVNGKRVKVLWTGRIDLGYSHAGSTYIVDHKTSSIATNMAEYELSHQFTGYEWAWTQLYGQPPAGITINRLVCRKPSKTGIPFTFDRKTIPYSPFRVEEWRRSILWSVHDFLQMAERGFFPMHTAWCVGKFGVCPFHKVCTVDDHAGRQLLLQSGEYENNPWSPLTED